MIEELTFDEVVKHIQDGKVREGEVLRWDSGKMTLKEGILYHVTESNVVTTPVIITEEVLFGTFSKVPNVKTEYTLIEALEKLDAGDTIFSELIEIENEVLVSFEFNTLHEFRDTIAHKQASLILPLLKAKWGVLSGNHVGKDTLDGHKGLKLTSNDAYDILVSYHHFNVTAKELGNIYGVSERMVYYIIDGTYWGHVLKRYQREVAAEKEFKQ